MKNNLKFYLKPLLLVTSLVLVGLLLLTIVYTLPTSPMKKNVVSSLNTLNQEGQYQDIAIRSARDDNFTSASMLNLSYYQSKNNALISAINCEMVGSHTGEGPAFQNLNLKAALDGDYNSKTIRSYSYLWHGYLIWLKVFLYKLDLGEIRVITYTVNMLLFVSLAILLHKKLGLKAVIPYVVASIFFATNIEATDITYSIDLNIMTIGSIFVLITYGKEYWTKNRYLIFTTLGFLAAFSSMLIVPLITLGVPLAVLMMLMIDDKKISNSKMWNELIVLILSWLFGYIFTMFSKILLSNFVNGFSSGSTIITYYLGDKNLIERFFRIKSITTDVIYQSHARIYLSALLGIILMLLDIRYFKKINLKRYLPILSLILIPFGWLYIVEEHSLHYCTRFLFLIPIMVIIYILLSIIDTKKLKNSLSKIKIDI